VITKITDNICLLEDISRLWAETRAPFFVLNCLVGFHVSFLLVILFISSQGVAVTHPKKGNFESGYLCQTIKHKNFAPIGRGRTTRNEPHHLNSFYTNLPSKLLTSTVTRNFDRVGSPEKFQKIIGSSWLKKAILSQSFKV
jgi:hypothetical protein